MDIMSYVLIAIVVLVILFAKMALVIIPQSETKIIERLGRYYATLNPQDYRASGPLLCHAESRYQHHHSLHRPRQGHRCTLSRTLCLL